MANITLTEAKAHGEALAKDLEALHAHATRLGDKKLTASVARMHENFFSTRGAIADHFNVSAHIIARDVIPAGGVKP